MASSQPTDVSSRAHYTHDRGNKRRQALLNAAIKLFTERAIDEVSFIDIAKQAGIPTASAYHFYRNKNDLMMALVDHYHHELLQLFGQPMIESAPEHWSDIIDLLVDHSIAYYNQNIAARNLFYSGKAPQEIKLRERVNAKALSDSISNIIDYFFVTPEIPNREQVFFIALGLADTIFSLSVIEHGTITKSMENETRRATKAYMSVYLPEVLPCRN